MMKDQWEFTYHGSLHPAVWSSKIKYKFGNIWAISESLSTCPPVETFGGRSRKHRLRNRPDQSWTPMMPNMKKTKKQSRRTLPSMGNVSSNRVTRIRKPAKRNKSSFCYFSEHFHNVLSMLFLYLFFGSSTNDGTNS